MPAAYEIAKAGGRHKGLIRRFANEPEAKILRSIRSLQRMIEEHQDKIENPMYYVSADISDLHLRDLTGRYWPEETENFRQQIEVLIGILEDRKNVRSS
jgi:hypothetical protein